MDQQQDTAEKALKEAIELQSPLLRHASNETMRRQAATDLLQALQKCLEELDDSGVSVSSTNTARQAFSVLLSELGPGDSQIRSVLLKTLDSLSTSPDCRQVVLDFLPPTMPIEEDETATIQVISCLRNVLQKDQTALIPVLGCLSTLPLSESGRNESFQVAVTALPMVSEGELPTLLRTLLRHVSTEEQAASAWTELRHELRLLQESEKDFDETDGDPLTLVAHIVLSSFCDSDNGNLLSSTYINNLERIELDSKDDSCLLVDLIVLLALVQNTDYSAAIDRIMDSWLTGDRFPFSALDSSLQMACGRRKEGEATSMLYKRLAPSFLRLAIFLLLAPARTQLSQIMNNATQSFVLNLHHRLDREQQAELVQSLLHLSEESAIEWKPAATRGRRKRKANSPSQDFQRLIHQSVNAVISSLAQTAPSTLVQFKHILKGRLSSTLFDHNLSDQASIKGICVILSSLVDSDRLHNGGGLDSSELMMLLQKLLFSSSGAYGGAAGDGSRIVRGLLLATELIRSPSVSRDDKDCIKEWVLRILLPSTRRMVAPELGAPGLDFLQAWMKDSNDGKAKAIFQHFKMILANTGLIQMLSQYQQTKRKYDAFLGKPEPLELFGSQAKDTTKTREFVFCVAFFLRHNDMTCPSRWQPATKWVFELVDTYLKMGREKATSSWVPNGWLQAAIEFPKLRLWFSPSSKKEKEALNWIQRRLSCFKFPNNDPPPANYASEIAEMIARIDESKDLRKLKDAVFQFALSLMLATSLSAAVLENAFAHFKDHASGDGINKANDQKHTDLLRLIQYQMSKLHCLQDNTRLVVSLLGSLARGIRKQKRGTRMPEELSMCNKMQTDIEFGINEIATLQSAFCSSFRYVGQAVLWECLADPGHDSLLRNMLNAFANGGRTLDDKDAASAGCVVQLRTRILEQISSALEKTVNEGLDPQYRAHFARVVQSGLFLVDELPTLRKVYFATHQTQDHNEQFSMASLCVLTSSYMHLVALITGRSPAGDGSLRDQGLTFEDALEICKEGCGESGRSCVAGSSALSVAFKCFLDRLRNSEDSLVASAILDVLSVLALRSKGELTEKVIEASFTSLHTVYVNSDEYNEPIEFPYAFLAAMKAFRARATSDALQSLQRALEATIMRNSSEAVSHSRSFAWYRYGVLRHFGLLAHSSRRYSHFNKQLPPMIAELESFLEVLGSSASTEVGAKKVGKANPTVTRIPSLNAGTFLEYFELMLHLTIGVSALFSPDKGPTDSAACGPYRDFAGLLRLFRRLVRLYQDQFVVFPRKAGSIIFHASRQMLAVATSQLHRFVDWRNMQPLPSLQDKKAGVYDPGSIQYLQVLLDVMAASTSAGILDLCEFWQEQEAASHNMSKITTLHYCAEKALRTMKDVASSHNLRHPNLDMPQEEEIQNENVVEKVQGFHQMEKSSGGKKRRVALESSALSFESERPTKRRISPLSEDGEKFKWDVESSNDDRSSAGSFGVTGDWGNASDGESSTGSLNLDLKLSGH